MPSKQSPKLIPAAQLPKSSPLPQPLKNAPPALLLQSSPPPQPLTTSPPEPAPDISYLMRVHTLAAGDLRLLTSMGLEGMDSPQGGRQGTRQEVGYEGRVGHRRAAEDRAQSIMKG